VKKSIDGTLHDFYPLTFLAKNASSLGEVEIERTRDSRLKLEQITDGTLHDFYPLTFFGQECFFLGDVEVGKVKYQDVNSRRASTALSLEIFL